MYRGGDDRCSEPQCSATKVPRHGDLAERERERRVRSIAPADCYITGRLDCGAAQLPRLGGRPVPPADANGAADYDGIRFYKVGTNLLPGHTVTVTIGDAARAYAGIMTERGPAVGYSTVTYTSCTASTPSSGPGGVWWVGGFTLVGRSSDCVPLEVQVTGEPTSGTSTYSSGDHPAADPARIPGRHMARPGAGAFPTFTQESASNDAQVPKELLAKMRFSLQMGNGQRDKSSGATAQLNVEGGSWLSTARGRKGLAIRKVRCPLAEGAQVGIGFLERESSC